MSRKAHPEEKQRDQDPEHGGRGIKSASSSREFASACRCILGTAARWCLSIGPEGTSKSVRRFLTYRGARFLQFCAWRVRRLDAFEGCMRVWIGVEWWSGGSLGPGVPAPLLRSRALFHRGIFQDRRAVLALVKFTDKCATDIVLINRPRTYPGMKRPSRATYPWGMRIARDECQGEKWPGA